MGDSSRRDLTKQQFWRRAIARFTTSGVTKAEFCRREGLSADVLRYWILAIAQRDEEMRLAELSKAKGKEQVFLPVVVVEQKATDRLPGTHQMAVAEIVVAQGTVRLFNGITTDTCRALWRALQEGIK